MKKRLLTMVILIIMISANFISTPAHAAGTATWKVLWLICPEVAASTAVLSDDDIAVVKDVTRYFADFIYESTEHALRVDIDVIISEYTVETLSMYGNSYCIA